MILNHLIIHNVQNGQSSVLAKLVFHCCRTIVVQLLQHGICFFPVPDNFKASFAASTTMFIMPTSHAKDRQKLHADGYYQGTMQSAQLCM